MSDDLDPKAVKALDAIKWPTSEPDAVTLMRYAAARGEWLLGVEQGLVGRVLNDEATDTIRLRYSLAISTMIASFNLYRCLETLRSVDAEKADVLARDLWLCAECGDPIPELLWEFCEAQGLDAEALRAAGEANGRGAVVTALNPAVVRVALDDALCNMPDPGPRHLSPSTVTTLFKAAQAWLDEHESKPSPVETAWAAFSVDLDALRADPSPLRALADAIEAEKRQDAERVTWTLSVDRRHATLNVRGVRIDLCANQCDGVAVPGEVLAERIAAVRSVLRPECEQS